VQRRVAGAVKARELTKPLVEARTPVEAHQ